MDIIQQAIEGIGKVLAKALFDKENDHEIVIEQPGAANSCAMLINALVSEGDYNTAENILFEELEKHYDYELYNVGLGFFARLATLTDAELEAGNYSREEIEQGLADLKALIDRWDRIL